jgi:CheY-like chemotaxis protein
MIRTTPNYRDMPVIIISASRDGEQIANDHRASAFIAKPFDYDHLLTVVEQLLN